MHKLPEFAKPSDTILSIITHLCNLPNLAVYIISGRSRTHLEKWFKDTGVGLAAEHGCFYRHPTKLALFPDDQKLERVTRKKDRDWIVLVDAIDVYTGSVVNNTWKDLIRPLFQHYTERTPGSFIEEKEINLTWHYRNSDPEFGGWQAAELQVNLEKILSHLAVSVPPPPLPSPVC